MEKENKQLLEELKQLGFDALYVDDEDSYKVKVKINDIVIRPKGYNKKYYFHSDNTYKFIDHYDRLIANETLEKEGIQEPKNVGVLSKTKVQAWLDYLTKIDELLEEMSKEKVEKVNTFLQSLKGLPVHWYRKNFIEEKQGFTDTDNISGVIDKNGLSYRFSVDFRTGYIREDIEVMSIYDIENKLNAFLKMSDNKFINNL